MLLHAGYSSHEYTKINKLRNSSIPFPQDITLEVVLSLALFLVHIIYISTQREPVLSLVEDREILRGRFDPVDMNEALVVEEIAKSSAFGGVNRVTFMDIVKKRQEFKEWQVEQGKK